MGGKVVGEWKNTKTNYIIYLNRADLIMQGSLFIIPLETCKEGKPIGYRVTVHPNT